MLIGVFNQFLVTAILLLFLDTICFLSRKEKEIGHENTAIFFFSNKNYVYSQIQYFPFLYINYKKKKKYCSGFKREVEVSHK